MLEASYLAAFLGGILTLLSPCSALLLPAFFAYAFGGTGELVKKTGLFYLGLTTTLVPLGIGIAAVSRLVYGQRSTLILVSGLVIILLAWIIHEGSPPLTKVRTIGVGQGARKRDEAAPW